jgi:hypothetical protein
MDGGLNGFGGMSKTKKEKGVSFTMQPIKISPHQTLNQVVTEPEDIKPDMTQVPLTSVVATSTLASVLDRPGTLNLGTPTTPSTGLTPGGLFGDPFGPMVGTGLTPINTTGYTVIPTTALSLETPTTAMDTENGIISVKTSLVQL